MKELLKQIIKNFIDGELPETKARRMVLPAESGKVFSLVGARGTGKTFLFYHQIKKLRQEIQKDRIVYFNSEDIRLFPVTTQTMDMFLEAYYELYPDNKNLKVFFFFDEVLEIKDWQSFIKRLYESENCSIFISSSLPYLMRKELNTHFGGNGMIAELFPLEFEEFLKFKNITREKMTEKLIPQMKNSFNEYLISTSFPGLLHLNEVQRKKAINEYLDLVIYKDIAGKYGVSNIHLMKYLLKYLVGSSTEFVSINKIYNELKSCGWNVSRNSVYDYIDILRASYTIFGLPVYTKNIREFHRNPSKNYPSDTGLTLLMTNEVNQPKLLESVVYRQLRREYLRVWYYKADEGVDFIVEKKNGLQLINVCYDFAYSRLKKKKLESLKEAMEELKVENAYLLTSESEGKEFTDTGMIKIIPVWQWLMGW